MNSYRLPLDGKYANGRFALLDTEDAERVSAYRWRADERDYVYTYIKSARVYLHRFVMNVDNDMYVDHKNHNKLDNRKSNLRKCTNSQNQANTKSWMGKETKGVYKMKNRWVARISVNGNRIYLGRYVDKNEALDAYNKKAKELFGEFAYFESMK